MPSVGLRTTKILIRRVASSLVVLCTSTRRHLPPTDAPTNAPTDVWQGEKECNPKHCSDWTCKDWCTCFSSDALLVEVFEGETPTEDDLYAREMCLTDDDDCNCDMYE